MKLSKSAKARIKRMSKSERSACIKAVNILADAEMITLQRTAAILRTLHNTPSY